jgi:hypothetical protein
MATHPEIPTERDPLVVTTTDKTCFRCWVEHMGNEGFVPFGSGRRSGGLRWVFEENGTRHLGPLFVAPESSDHLQRVVERWWENANKKPSYADVRSLSDAEAEESRLPLPRDDVRPRA